MQTPLGQKLKAAREKRGLSLLDASHATKIPVQRLHLLEQDNFAGFGSMTYARAFLKVYSHFLGVNAHEMLEELPEGVLGGTCDYRYLTDSHGHWVVPREQRVSRASGPAHALTCPSRHIHLCACSRRHRHLGQICGRRPACTAVATVGATKSITTTPE